MLQTADGGDGGASRRHVGVTLNNSFTVTTSTGTGLYGQSTGRSGGRGGCTGAGPATAARRWPAAPAALRPSSITGRSSSSGDGVVGISGLSQGGNGGNGGN